MAEKEAVSNSIPLIHLSKINKLVYLKNLFKRIYIPKEVFEEVVVRGKEQGKEEAIQIERLIGENFIIVKDVDFKLNLLDLHLGELKAISLCQKLEIMDLLIDDKIGVKTAKAVGLKPLRTSALLLRLLSRKIIAFDEFKDSLLLLSKNGYFLSAEIYEELLEAGRNL